MKRRKPKDWQPGEPCEYQYGARADWRRGIVDRVTPAHRTPEGEVGKRIWVRTDYGCVPFPSKDVRRPK